MGKVPLQVLRNLNTKLGRISTPSISQLLSLRLPLLVTVVSTFKRVKSQIQKGADPERAARCGYENACEYFEIMNKRILIQQRALACLSKYVAHILLRYLYTMGNTGLLRSKVEMTLLQPHLGDSRRRELRNLPFSLLLSSSQSRMEKTSSLKKAYLHIPIHPNSKKYLRFCHKSQVFQTRGIRLHQYLGDWVIRAKSQKEAEVDTQW